MDISVSMMLTRLDGPDSKAQVAKFLALVFESETPTSIEARMQSLPMLISDELDQETAKLIERHLVARGAAVNTILPTADAGGVSSGGPWEDDNYDGYGDTREMPSYASMKKKRSVEPLAKLAIEPTAGVKAAASVAPSPTRKSVPSTTTDRPAAASPQKPAPPPKKTAPEPPPWEESATPKKKKGLFGGLLKR